MKKACCLGVLPADLELEARLALARKVGFDAVEPNTLRRKSDVKALQKAAANAGVAGVISFHPRSANPKTNNGITTAATKRRGDPAAPRSSSSGGRYQSAPPRRAVPGR